MATAKKKTAKAKKVAASAKAGRVKPAKVAKKAAKVTKTAAKKAGAAPKRSSPRRAKGSSDPSTSLTTSELVARARAVRGAPAAIAEAIGKLAAVSASWTVVSALRVAVPCYRPTVPFVVIDGDLHVSGNLVVATGKHDGGVLVVLGNVQARNVAVGAGWSLVCTGDLHAEEVIESCADDSVTYVGGRVGAYLLDSGSGAWLTMFGSRTALRATHVSGYVMNAKGDVWEPKATADVTEIVIDDALETEEWDSLDAEDRKGESKADYVRVDTDAVLRILGKGGGVLREARSGRAG